MKGISHKQAVKLIHLRLDGLLKESQSLSLNTHLDTCDSCRDYAAEMDALPARLQNEFQSRWDQNAGPSHRMLERVTTGARKIPMTNRISSSIRLMASAFLVAFLILGINFVVLQMKSNPIKTIGTQSVSGSELIGSNLIAFVYDQGGNAEIYTMESDGSGLTNLTNYSAHDVNPVWSPDGKLIAFESDRTGFIQIYTMNPNGSNLTQLTNEEADHSIGTKYGDTPEPWSPDGKKIIFSQTVRGDENNMLYVMNVDGSNKIALTDEPGLYTFLGWSPDGQKIVYQTPNFGHNSESRIMIADVDGTGTIEGIVGKDFGISSQIQWKAADELVLLAANSTMEPPNWQLSRMFVTTDTTVYNRFGPTIVDSNVPIVALFENTYVTEDQDALRWFSFNDSPVPTSPWYFPTECEKPVSDQFMTDTYHIVSPDRRHAFVVILCGEGAHFYLENADGTQINQLGTPITGQSQVNEVTWSPDGKHVIATIINKGDNDSTDLLRFDIQEMLNDPSTKPIQLTTDGVWKYGVAWQPVSNHEMVEENPTPEPTQIAQSKDFPPIGTGKGNGKWIAFLASTDGIKSDVHIIHPDGSGLSNNLTNSPDYYFWLEWSPNGNDLLFLRSSDNAGGVDILRKIEPIGFEVLVHTGVSREAPFLYRWSPNSEQIAYVDNLAGNSDIYTIYADGRSDTQPKQLTNDPGQEIDFAWSPDGSQIAYQRTIGDQLSIIVMAADGSNQHEVARGKGEVRLYWSVNGNSIYVSSTENNWLECDGCIQAPAIYQIDLDRPSVHQIYFEKDASKVAGWYLYDTLQNVLNFMRVDYPAFVEFWGTWFRADGNSVTEIGEMDPHQTCNTATGNVLNESISPNPRFSVISNFCGRGFNLYLADREAMPEKRFNQLLQLPLDTLGQGGDFATLPMVWSPDGRWIAYDNGNSAIYLLNIEATRQDPVNKRRTGGPLLLWQSENDLITFSEIVWQPVSNHDVVDDEQTPEPMPFTLTINEAETLAGFDILEPAYIPAGYILNGFTYDTPTQKIIMKYVSQIHEGMIFIYQQHGDLTHDPEVRAYVTPVPIGDIEAEYIQGAWIYESPNTTEPTWNPRADSYSLSWQKGEFIFSVNFIGGETITPLPLNELVAIGESLK